MTKGTCLLIGLMSPHRQQQFKELLRTPGGRERLDTYTDLVRQALDRSGDQHLATLEQETVLGTVLDGFFEDCTPEDVAEELLFVAAPDDPEPTPRSDPTQYRNLVINTLRSKGQLLDVCSLLSPEVIAEAISTARTQEKSPEFAAAALLRLAQEILARYIGRP